MSKPTTTSVVESTPEHDTASQAPEQPQALEQAQQAAEQAQAAQADAEAREEQAREDCIATLKAMVRAYSKGERDYRSGLLEAGRLAHQYIAQRLAPGDKRAAAVQAIEGQLAAYASDSVDVNRLVRSYQAHLLLCEQPGLGKQAGCVSYGVYRDAWCMLVERVNKDTAQESYVLLPGLEQECLAAYADAVKGGLSKAASVERAKALVQQHVKQAERRARAEREAAEAEARAKQQAARTEQLARDRAETLARVKEQAAKAALDAAQAAQDDQEKATAEAAARAARRQAEEARRDADSKRFAQEQAARAAQEARDAARREADAEAKRASQERKAERRERKQEPPADPARETRGENLLKTMARATPKDVAGMLAEAVQAHDDPEAVLYDLARTLLGGHAKLTPEAVARTLFLALDHAKGKLPEQAGKAVQAARLVLTRKATGDHAANGKAATAAA